MQEAVQTKPMTTPEAPQPQHQQRPQFNPAYNPFTRAKVIMCGVAFVWVIALLVATISSSVSVANAQMQYQNAMSASSSYSSKNTTLQQEISELSSRSHLQKVASQANMTINNKSVRNVTK